MGEPVLSTEQTQRSLWLGDLAPWIDENFLVGLFVGTNQLVSVKLIRNRATGSSEGYAFLEFRTHEAADTILKTYNGHPIPGTDLVFRLNWAAYGVGKAQPAGEDFSLFVGDLAPDVSDLILQEYFRQFYPSVRSAKVITDAITGRSKGYGFVRFAGEGERDRALAEMNGHFLSNRPIRVSLATARKSLLSTTPQPIVQSPHPSDFDPTNTTLFIGGLSSQVSEDQLRAVFSRFGDIIYVKIPQGKGCGFVQFVLRTSAEQAMAAMNGQVLGNSAIRISWGRSSSRASNPIAQLAGLTGLPAAGFPTPFAADPALLAAAAGAYGSQFNPAAAVGMLSADSYASLNGITAGPQPSGAPMDPGYVGYRQLHRFPLLPGQPQASRPLDASHLAMTAPAAFSGGLGKSNGLLPPATAGLANGHANGSILVPESGGPLSIPIPIPAEGTVRSSNAGSFGAINGHIDGAVTSVGGSPTKTSSGSANGNGAVASRLSDGGMHGDDDHGAISLTTSGVSGKTSMGGAAGLVGAHLIASLLL